MPYPNNLRKTSIPTKLDSSATEFFNNYLQPGFTVSSAVNDTVIGFFERLTDNRASAEIMASAVIYTSMAQKVDPITIIEKMNTLPDSDVASYVTMFLNLNRLGSSYLGTHSGSNTNKYVSRSITPLSGQQFDGSEAAKAAPSAAYIKKLTGTMTNGTYWIRGYNDVPMLAYCDMNGTEAGSSVGGWMRFDQALVSTYRGTAIRDAMIGYVYANNGAYNVNNIVDSRIHGVRWDLGANIKFSGARCQHWQFDAVGGPDGWDGIDGPTPNWVGARPTDTEVIGFFETPVTMGSGTNAACFGVSVGNGNPGTSNLARLYRGRLNNTEWPNQATGIVTLTAGSFLQYDTKLRNGRFVYFYESDSVTEYSNLQQYRIWLR